MKLRDLTKMRDINDGTRSLLESILPNEVLVALTDWKKYVNTPVLIGGVALSFYAKPRYTEDLDYLFLNDADIPNAVSGFKRMRAHAFQHDKTHVEIEVLTPAVINTSEDLVRKVYETAVENDGVKIASREGLIALKLGRLTLQDKADIVAIINSGDVDLSGWPLTDVQIEAHNELENIAEEEK